jgi:hypothetical protein
VNAAGAKVDANTSPETSMTFGLGMSDRRLVRLKWVSYNLSQSAELVVNLGLVLLNDYHVNATLLDFSAAPRIARGW